MALPEGLIGYLGVALGAVVAPAVFGLGLVRALGLPRDAGWRLAIGCGYVVGHYVAAHVTFVWLWLGQPLPGWSLPLGMLLVGGWLWRRVVHGAARQAPASPPRPPTPWPQWVPLALLVLVFVYHCLAKNAEPVRYSDEAVNWASKAKVLYTAPDFAVGEGLAFFVQHADYPLLNPLAQVLAFATAGRVCHFENRLPIQGFAIALLLVLSAATWRRAHGLVATLALVAFAGTSFAQWGPPAYADIVLAAATLVAGEALLRARETGAVVWWRLGCLGLGAMIASKNEGTLLALTLAGSFAVVHAFDRWRGAAGVVRWRSLPWLVVPLAALACHRGFNAWFGVQNDLFDPALGRGRGLFERIVDQLGSSGPAVADFYLGMLLDPAPHRWLPLLFVVVAPFAIWVHRSRWFTGAPAVLWLTTVGATLGYMLVFVGTTYDVQWHMAVAADRTMQHVLPLVVVGLCASAWPRDGGPGAVVSEVPGDAARRA
jgi:hypothetical protein